ncbi:hypothetical protein IJF81_03670 [bacterium]|nr:hypothetical protein [bacterium]
MKAFSAGMEKVPFERTVVRSIKNVSNASKNTDKINDYIGRLSDCPKLQKKIQTKLNQLDEIDPKRAEQFGLYLIDRYWGSNTLQRIIQRYNFTDDVLDFPRSLNSINYFM